MSFKVGDRVRCVCNSARESHLTVGEEYVVEAKLPWDDIFALEGRPDVFFHGSRFELIQAAEPLHYLVMARAKSHDVPVRLFESWDEAKEFCRRFAGKIPGCLFESLGWPNEFAERIGVITLRDGVPVSWQEVKEFDSDEVPEGGGQQDGDTGVVSGSSGGLAAG